MSTYKTTVEESSYGLFHLSLRSADEIKKALFKISGGAPSVLHENILKYHLSIVENWKTTNHDVLTEFPSFDGIEYINLAVRGYTI